MTTGLKINAAFKRGQGDLKPKTPSVGGKGIFCVATDCIKLSKKDKIQLTLA